MVVLDNYHQRRCGFFIQVFGLILQSTKYNDKKRLEVNLVAFYRDQLLRYQCVIFLMITLIIVRSKPYIFV